MINMLLEFFNLAQHIIIPHQYLDISVRGPLSAINNMRDRVTKYYLVPRPHLRGGKGRLVILGKKLGPVDDPRRNLRIPIRSQLQPSHVTRQPQECKFKSPTQPYWPIRSELCSSKPVQACTPRASHASQENCRSHQTLFPPFEGGVWGQD